MKKTEAARILDRMGISYQLHPFEVDLEDLSATSAAEQIGVEAERVFKTLLVRGENGCHFTVIPSDASLDLKAVARLTENKKCKLVAIDELESLTGYVRGGVTVLGSKREYPALVDETIELFDTFFVSCGKRGMLMELAPADYLNAINASVAAITQ